MEQSVEQHTRPNQSKLTPYKKDIELRRAKNWPYRRIIQWLSDEKRITVAYETLRQFCRVRGISKKPAITIPQHRIVSVQKAHISKPKKKRIFEYTDDGPINIRR